MHSEFLPLGSRIDATCDRIGAQCFRADTAEGTTSRAAVLAHGDATCLVYAPNISGSFIRAAKRSLGIRASTLHRGRLAVPPKVRYAILVKQKDLEDFRRSLLSFRWQHSMKLRTISPRSPQHLSRSLLAASRLLPSPSASLD